jgi:hypothetical protein
MEAPGDNRKPRKYLSIGDYGRLVPCDLSRLKVINFGFSQRRSTSMCDYSLQFVASRPAKIGDQLVSTKFNNSVTRGFSAVGEPNVAVCLLPGTEVAFERDVEYDLFPDRKVGERLARFRKVNMDRPDAHHDALEFPNGEIVLVTRLYEGQHATVLQLPASPHTISEVEELRHDRVVT